MADQDTRLVIAGDGTTQMATATDASEKAARHVELRNQQSMALRLDDVAEQRIAAGYVFKGKLLKTDRASRERYVKLAMKALVAMSPPSSVLATAEDWYPGEAQFTYGAADGSRVVITAQEMIDVAEAVGDIERRELLRAQILAHQIAVATEIVDIDDPTVWDFVPDPMSA